MKTISLLRDVIGGDGEPLKEGSSHSLSDESANHWLKRGLAVEVSEELILDEPEPDTTKTESPHANHSGSRRHKRK